MEKHEENWKITTSIDRIYLENVEMKVRVCVNVQLRERKIDFL